MIDVMLVLLIMFIITIPIQTHAVKLNMPTPSNVQPTKPPDVMRIDVDFDGTIGVNGVLTSKSELDAKLGEWGALPLADQPEVHLRPNEGVDLLARASTERPEDTTLRGEWFVLLERLGPTAESSTFLASEGSDSLSPSAVEKALGEAIEQGTADALWKRLDTVIDRWIAGRRFEKVTTLLDRLARLEAKEHIPALERLLSAREAEGTAPATVRAVERLAEAHLARGTATRLAELRSRLLDLGAASPVLLTTDPRAEGPPYLFRVARFGRLEQVALQLGDSESLVVE